MGLVWKVRQRSAATYKNTCDENRPLRSLCRFPKRLDCTLARWRLARQHLCNNSINVQPRWGGALRGSYSSMMPNRVKLHVPKVVFRAASVSFQHVLAVQNTMSRRALGYIYKIDLRAASIGLRHILSLQLNNTDLPVTKCAGNRSMWSFS